MKKLMLPHDIGKDFLAFWAAWNRLRVSAMTYFTMYSYNLCWPVRTLRLQDRDDRWYSRTPAMAAGLADHIWSLRERLTYPAVQLT